MLYLLYLQFISYIQIADVVPMLLGDFSNGVCRLQGRQCFHLKYGRIITLIHRNPEQLRSSG